MSKQNKKLHIHVFKYYHIMSKPQLLCYVVYLPQAQGQCPIAKKVKNFLNTRVLMGVKLRRQQKFRIFFRIMCLLLCHNHMGHPVNIIDILSSIELEGLDV